MTTSPSPGLTAPWRCRPGRGEGDARHHRLRWPANPRRPAGSHVQRPYPHVVLYVAVLGPLEVTLDGERLHVPAGRSSELVVRLALEAGVPVSAERLVEDLWM